jgi:hypothetical protein
VARYAELEKFPAGLPVFDPGYDQAKIDALAHPDEPEPITSFLRTLYLRGPMLWVFSPLKFRRLLSITDRELDKCADLCGAQTVPHTWGQMPSTNGNFLKYVAEVDYIDGVCFGDRLEKPSPDIPPNIYQQVSHGLNQYNHPLQYLRRGHLHDMSRRQFMYGVNTNQPEQQDPNIYLVDIDPIFRYLDIPK